MDRSLDLWRRAAAEGLAAFALVFAGCGAIVADAVNDGALGAVGVSLVFGLIVHAHASLPAAGRRRLRCGPAARCGGGRPRAAGDLA